MEWNGMELVRLMHNLIVLDLQTARAAIAISSDNKFVVLTDSQSLDKEWCTHFVSKIDLTSSDFIDNTFSSQGFFLFTSSPPRGGLPLSLI
jgi:hypothetical protein